MTDERCKCLITRVSGDVIRCSAVANEPEKSKYCYYHSKIMNGLCSSAPQDAPGYSIDNDYIVMYTDMDTLKSVTNG